MVPEPSDAGTDTGFDTGLDTGFRKIAEPGFGRRKVSIWDRQIKTNFEVRDFLSNNNLWTLITCFFSTAAAAAAAAAAPSDAIAITSEAIA